MNAPIVSGQYLSREEKMKVMIGPLFLLILTAPCFANDVVCELQPMPLLRGPMTYNPINVTCTTENGATFSGFLDRRQGVKTAIYEAESNSTTLKFEVEYPKKTVQELVFFGSWGNEITKEIKRNNPSVSDKISNLHLSSIVVDENYLQVFMEISGRDYKKFFGEFYPEEMSSDDRIGRAPIFQFGKIILEGKKHCKTTHDSWAIEINSLGLTIAWYDLSCLTLNQTGDMLTHIAGTALCPLNDDGTAKAIEECRNFPWPTAEKGKLENYGYQKTTQPTAINRVSNINEAHPIYCYDYQRLNKVIGNLNGSSQKVFIAELLCDRLLPDGRIEFDKVIYHNCLSDERGQLPTPESCFADNSVRPRDFPF